jgi:hypothetical protein
MNGGEGEKSERENNNELSLALSRERGRVRVIHSLTDVFQYPIKIRHDLIVPIAKNTEAVNL